MIPNRMIESNDGGATITPTAGAPGPRMDNQPTAQFYRVALDQDFPVQHLRRAAGQHARCASRAAPRAQHHGADWYDVGGGESGWIAPDPRNSQIVYAGSYDGLLTRYDKRTGQIRNINVWPDNTMGYGAEAMKYRFQWNFPILFSPQRSEDAVYRFQRADEDHQ